MDGRVGERKQRGEMCSEVGEKEEEEDDQEDVIDNSLCLVRAGEDAIIASHTTDHTRLTLHRPQWGPNPPTRLPSRRYVQLVNMPFQISGASQTHTSSQTLSHSLHLARHFTPPPPLSCLSLFPALRHSLACASDSPSTARRPRRRIWKPSLCALRVTHFTTLRRALSPHICVTVGHLESRMPVRETLGSLYIFG